MCSSPIICGLTIDAIACTEEGVQLSNGAVMAILQVEAEFIARSFWTLPHWTHSTHMSKHGEAIFARIAPVQIFLNHRNVLINRVCPLRWWVFDSVVPHVGKHVINQLPQTAVRFGSLPFNKPMEPKVGVWAISCLPIQNAQYYR
jgi:hypothetical protein